MLTPAPCPFYHIETYAIAQDLAKNIGWSASTLTLYNVTNMTEKLPHYLIHYMRFSRHREPVRSTGRHPHGRRLATQPAFMLNSSSAPKSPHTPSAPNLRLPPAAWQSNRSSTAYTMAALRKGARAMRAKKLKDGVQQRIYWRSLPCGAVRCVAVQCSALSMLAAAVQRYAIWWPCRLFSRAWRSGERPRLKESGRGGHCSAEESIGSSPGALSRLTPCRPRASAHFFNREFPVRECESYLPPL